MNFLIDKNLLDKCLNCLNDKIHETKAVCKQLNGGVQRVGTCEKGERG